MNRISNLIYFNNNRTTPQDEAVTEIMLSTESIRNNDQTIKEKALQYLGELISAESDEMLFTSGTTESINLAIKGVYALNKHKGNHIITNKTEHFAVLDCCSELELQGAEITYLNVNREGIIDAEELRTAIKATTILVAIMAANNETGVIQPVERIAEICSENNILLFSDASQFAGKVRCDTKELGINCMAFGAHKMYGPDGIGLLYINKKNKDLINLIKKNYSIEFSLPQIAGFGKAAEVSQNTYWENSTHISKLKNYFEHHLLDMEGLRINGSTRHRLYTTSNIMFPASKNIIALREKYDFADNLKKPSYVLRAMGLETGEIKNSFRFSFGKYNTLDEVKMLVEDILKV